MFTALAPRYDRFNFWSSLGMDGRWRRALVRRLLPGEKVLDVGCGTGDLSRLAFRRGCRVTGLDFSEGMLAVARGRQKEVSWVRGSAAEMPFDPGSFDAVVSAYVMRNLFRGGILDESLSASSRVLRKGGRLLFLDLTRPSHGFLRWGHGIYLRNILPLIGAAVCGPSWPGDYLKTSIEELPSPALLERSFQKAGFSKFEIIPLSGGIVSLFTAEKC